MGSGVVTFMYWAVTGVLHTTSVTKVVHYMYYGNLGVWTVQGTYQVYRTGKCRINRHKIYSFKFQLSNKDPVAAAMQVIPLCSNIAWWVLLVTKVMVTQYCSLCLGGILPWEQLPQSPFVSCSPNNFTPLRRKWVGFQQQMACFDICGSFVVTGCAGRNIGWWRAVNMSVWYQLYHTDQILSMEPFLWSYYSLKLTL